ncbi:MAG: hypothetical protein BME94_01765 [Methanobacteriales archaeon Met13]
MYRIIRFKGGVYKFDELAEYLDDVGGLLIQEDRLHINRGSYFISQELQVIMIVPSAEVKHLIFLARNIKGEIEEEVSLEEKDEVEMFRFLILHNFISQTNSWVSLSRLKELMEFSNHGEDLIGLDLPDGLLPDIRKSLDSMCSLELLDKRDNQGTMEYRIKIKEE